MKRSYKIIADDYGLGIQHSRRMRKLLCSGAIDGVSVMVSESLIGFEAKKLINVVKGSHQEIGLHLNLTEPLKGMGYVCPITKLLCDSLLGRLNLVLIRQSVLQQVELFCQIFNKTPDFIDGHQHCHVFPQISNILIDVVIQKKLNHKHFWIRSPAPTHFKSMITSICLGGIKSMVVMALGSHFRKKIKAFSLNTNHDFLGFLNLTNTSTFEARMNRLFGSVTDGCLVMVHPGSSLDIIQTKGHLPELREKEAEYLQNLTKFSGFLGWK